MSHTLSPHFLNSEGLQLLVVGPRDLSRHVVLVVPPIFEELNLSLAVLRKLQPEIEHSFVRFDFAGTGDSEGSIDQVSTDTWLQNLLDVGRYLLAQGVEEITLLGVRFGALLVLAHQEVLHTRLPVTRQIVWKPLVKGSALVNQMMRLKHTNHVLAGGDKVDWRAKLNAGETIEVAGYPLTERLIKSIESLSLHPDSPPKSQLHWLDLGGEQLSPAVTKFQQAWRGAQFKSVPCSSFWQIPEIFEEPALYSVHREILGRE